MKTLIGSNNRSPLRCGFFTMAIALGCFALSPPLKAVDCPSTCDTGLNTGVGTNALSSVNPAGGGINNTAVGFGALKDTTTGFFNTAVGTRALEHNIIGNFNMAIGTEALNQNKANFNLAIGFRVGFQNSTGNHLTGIGAAALRNNTTGNSNTAIGADALRENTDGEQNTAVGSAALTTLNGGSDNTAVGFQALLNNLDGIENVAVGRDALLNLGANGDFNTALGTQALVNQTAGEHNIAIGEEAADSITTGSANVVIGAHAGGGITDGSGNVVIGFLVGAAGNQSNRTFIGNLTNNQIQTFNGTTVKNVTCEVATGRLGITAVTSQAGDGPVSSRRYKEDIKPMDKTSEAILALKPVTFRFKKEVETAHVLGFGLIAEDVREVNPDLVVLNEKGEPQTVRYEAVNVMLLNEFLKEHKKVEEQQASIAELKSTVALQQKGMEVLTAQLKEQAAQIQKVSAQLDVSKPAPRTVANK